jgi:hypothetical protein
MRTYIKNIRRALLHVAGCTYKDCCLVQTRIDLVHEARLEGVPIPRSLKQYIVPLCALPTDLYYTSAGEPMRTGVTTRYTPSYVVGLVAGLS